MQSVQFYFVADGGLMNFDIGFKPTYVELISALGGTELVHRYFEVLADDELTGQYGIIDDGAGVLGANSSGSGIIPYEEGDDLGVMILHPGTGELVAATVADWLAATSYSSGERTATAIGTIVRPPTHNGKVFELTTDTGSGTSEPSSWDVEPGETVTDGGSNIWTCRKEIVKKAGGQGFAVEAGISTDSEKWVARAVKDDRVANLGDIDGYDPIRVPN